MYFNVRKCKELVIFWYFKGLKLLISQKVRATREKRKDFKKIVVFRLSGLIFIKKTGGKHDLRIAPKMTLLTPTPNTKIIMHDTPLQQVHNIKFLGVMINDKLTWEDHKQLISSKICKTIGILYKCKHFMNKDECTKMYKTFIQPYFLYSIEVWGHTIQAENDILVKLQSKVLRILFNCKRSQDAWKHSNGNISSIKDLYKITIQKLCMKHLPSKNGQHGQQR